MLAQALRKVKLPDHPGVYRFLGAGKKILYIGKATSLRDRVKSYAANDLLHTRGKHIVDMVALAKRVRAIRTDSVLEAVILEASLIKKHQPLYNTKEKDDKSWNYVVITKEEYPRVLILRERTMALGAEGKDYAHTFGPFPGGSNLKEALRIVRKIFPFRDTCARLQGKPCFNRQIGLCPGVCTGEISQKEYAERIREIVLFWSGKKGALLKRLERSMRLHAKAYEFEEAGECKRAIFALKHIKDVSLINEEVRAASFRSSGKRRKAFRIESYDIAHISGKYTVGVMGVVLDGRPMPSAYRKFKIRSASGKSNDLLHLEEVLRRRSGHPEWPKPDLVVVDGGSLQKSRAEKVFQGLGKDIPVVAVVKDERHKPKAILGDQEIAESYRKGILIGNAEAHRFAVSYHRQLRGKLPK